MSEASAAFVGYAYHPSLGEEAVLGRIVFTQWRLRFEAEGVVREIPLTKLRIEPGDDTDGRISFYDPADREWVVWTFDDEILQRGPLLQQPHTRNQIQAMRSGGELNRRVKVTVGFIVGFAAICFLVSLLLGLIVRAMVQHVPAKWEKKIGDDVMAEVKAHEEFVHDPKLKARLDHAVAPLLNVLPKAVGGYKFYIVDDPLPNAFALPGGHVVVHNSLLTLADKPEEIAGVIAHELAHVTLKHGFLKIVSSAGPYLIVKIFFGGGDGLLGFLGGSSQLLVRQSFSQEYEFEADKAGWEYLVKAQVDPRGLEEMLKKLDASYYNMNGAMLELGAFSSHPTTEKRIARLEGQWKKLKNKTGFKEYEPLETKR